MRFTVVELREKLCGNQAVCRIGYVVPVAIEILPVPRDLTCALGDVTKDWRGVENKQIGICGLEL
jgi:hypothetical protein